MTKILTIGAVTQDIFFPTDEGIIFETPKDLLSKRKIAYELGSKCHIKKRYTALGGCSANVACGLSRLGENVSVYGCIGDDIIGKWIQKELGKIGVDTALIEVQKNCESDLSAIVVDKNSADRVIFTNQVANQKLVIDGKKISNPHWIFIGDLTGKWRENIETILSIARKNNINIAFNPRQSTIHEDVKMITGAISYSEILFVNKDEAIEIISGFQKDVLPELLDEEEYLVKEIYKIGAKIVALTDGERGAWAYDGIAVLHIDAILQNALDSTGAGDAFTSGFLAAHFKGKNLMTALKWGIVNSSNSVTEYGGQKGLLSQEEIENVITRIVIKK